MRDDAMTDKEDCVDKLLMTFVPRQPNAGFVSKGSSTRQD